MKQLDIWCHCWKTDESLLFRWVLALASLYPTGDGGSPNNFFNGGSKIGLQFSVSAPITLRLKEVTPWRSRTFGCCRLGVTVWVPPFGTHPLGAGTFGRRRLGTAVSALCHVIAIKW